MSGLLQSTIRLAASAFGGSHQYHRHQIESGEETLPEEVRPFFETGRREAKRILRKYGKKKLVLNDFEWGYLNGQHETAAWVLGAEWDEAGDT